MAHTKSALKRHRKSITRNIHNKSVKSSLKTLVKKLDVVIAAGDVEGAKKGYSIIQKKLDKAARTRVVHPNTANRRKASLAKKISALAAKK